MRNLLLVVLLLSHAHLALSCGYSIDSPRPLEREAARIQALLFEGKFAELTRIDEQSRNVAVAISDGQPLRGVFASALDASEIDCSRAPNEERLAKLAIYRAKMKAWREASPALAAPQLFEALYPLREAWIARGGEYAGQVAPEAWPIFRQHVETARQKVEALPAKVKDDPAWHVARLEIMRLQSDPADRYTARLEAALKKYPTYLRLYFEAAEFYGAKWGGTEARFSAFIDRSVSRTKASMGEELYARLRWYNWEPTMFRDGSTSWPRMKAGFERIVKDYPDPWNLNNFAKFACMARDFKVLGELMSRIQGAVILLAWGDMTFYQRCAERLKAGE